ncbi:MAG: D-2-hydroxyacid dehydrogenase [Caldilineaceae bacterium]|nr:D-2-hydroxyacid dehydrogenase [Caldilineaceae bacterium]
MLSTQPPILILTARAQQYQQLLEAALPDLTFIAAPTVEAARPVVEQTSIILGDPRPVRSLLNELPALRWVQCTWAGVDLLVEPGLRRDYILTNVRDVFGPLMAEYVLGYALMLERRGWQRFRAQMERRWDSTVAGTLRGKRLGLLGVGSIGGEIARMAHHFGMATLGYTRASEDCPHIDAYYHGDACLQMAAQCDYLVSTLPDTAASRRLVNRELLAALPPHAVFMNVGRGSVVDEDALMAALQEGSIAGAVLDVLETEPLPPEHPLWTVPNVLITSHTAAASFPTDIAPIFVENYRRFQAGEPLLYRVEFERGY